MLGNTVETRPELKFLFCTLTTIPLRNGAQVIGPQMKDNQWVIAMVRKNPPTNYRSSLQRDAAFNSLATETRQQTSVFDGGNNKGEITPLEFSLWSQYDAMLT